jgi:hypothetical protein
LAEEPKLDKDLKNRQQKEVSFSPQLEDVQYNPKPTANRESHHSLSEYYDSYSEEQPAVSFGIPALDEQGKPLFTSRGSSLKNLQSVGHKGEEIPNSVELEVPMVLPPHKEKAELKEHRYEPRRIDTIDERPEIQEVKVLNHRFEPVVRKESVSEKKVEQKQIRVAQSREQLRDHLREQLREQEAPQIPQMQFGVSRHPSQRAQVVIEPSTSESTTQTDQDQVKELLSHVELLKKQLLDAQEENQKLKETSAEQKRGFDKLSAQAYKKIKELLTDRNIMQIEIKALKNQVLFFNQDGSN